MQADWFEAHCRQQLPPRGSRLGPTAGQNSFSVNKPAGTDIFRRLRVLHVSIFEGHGKVLGSHSGGKGDQLCLGPQAEGGARASEGGSRVSGNKYMHLGDCGGVAMLADEPKSQPPAEGPWAVMISTRGSA